MPPRGHVPPVHGALAASDLSVVGLLGKYVADIRLIDPIVEGAAAHRPCRLGCRGYAAEKLEDLRIGVWASDGFYEVDSEIETAIVGAAEKLSARARGLFPSSRISASPANRSLYDAAQRHNGRGYSPSVHARLQV